MSLERNRTKKGVCVSMCVCYKELAQVMMESAMSQDLHGELATQRPRNADGEFLSGGRQFQNPGRANVSVSIQKREKKPWS